MAGLSLTEAEWDRLKELAQQSDGRVLLDESIDGTCVIVRGFGVFHPRSFLDLVGEFEPAHSKRAQ